MRRTVLPALPAAAVLCILAPAPALAHHGWEEYDTTRPVYVAGTVSDVTWGNPHPEVRIDVSRPVRLPRDLAGRSLPEELEAIGGRDVLRHTRAYEGSAAALDLVLAPIERLAAWGMPDELEEGERIELIGYPHPDDGAELRPELLIRDGGDAVRQRSVPLPHAPEGGPEDAPPAAPDEGGGDGGAGDAAAVAQDDGSGTATATLWILGAGGVLAAGAAVYAVARRARRS